jgi:hypothetical protein
MAQRAVELETAAETIRYHMKEHLRRGAPLIASDQRTVMKAILVAINTVRALLASERNRRTT